MSITTAFISESNTMHGHSVDSLHVVSNTIRLKVSAESRKPVARNQVYCVVVERRITTAIWVSSEAR